MFGKKGVFGFHELIFIILNIIFFTGMAFFVYNSSTGTLVYEQMYSKQIALYLDNAKPTSLIKVDFTEAIQLAEKTKDRKLTQQEKNNMVSISNGEVLVSLGEAGGYSTKYFTDYEITSYVDDNKNLLVLTINEKQTQGS